MIRERQASVTVAVKNDSFVDLISMKLDLERCAEIRSHVRGEAQTVTSMGWPTDDADIPGL